MSFWNLSVPNPDAPALLLGGDHASTSSISYGQLAALADDLWLQVKRTEHKGLGILLCNNSRETYVAYLAALRGGDAVILLSDQIEASLLETILQSYRPDWILRPASSTLPKCYCAEELNLGWQVLRRLEASNEVPIHVDLAVLLSTSGTTGSPKMVRLSYENIESNARSIMNYLEITSNSNAITSLPFNYSYGMSVANSHFYAGASLTLTDASLMSKEFWDTFECHNVSSLAGVPYTFQMLQRLNPSKLPLASLKTLTQAGGALDLRLLDYFREISEERGWRFFVMYGQTEASPRISYVPPTMLATKRGSIGVPIPGGKLSVSVEGELIYEGPNVMMGYGECRDDLGKDDELYGRLATGDLAVSDDDGYFFLRGRLKRFVKVFGNRVSLDEIEQKLESELGEPVASIGENEKIHVFLPVNSSVDKVRSVLTNLFHLHSTTFSIHQLETLPYTSSGKKDYAKLRS